jgi:hypothetical protein
MIKSISDFVVRNNISKNKVWNQNLKLNKIDNFRLYDP